MVRSVETVVGERLVVMSSGRFNVQSQKGSVRTRCSDAEANAGYEATFTPSMRWHATELGVEMFCGMKVNGQVLASITQDPSLSKTSGEAAPGLPSHAREAWPSTPVPARLP